MDFSFTSGSMKLFGSIVLLFPVCQCLSVKGVLHQDVLLPCMVDCKDNFDYNRIVVNWQRSENDAVVHSFFRGSSRSEYQTDNYRGRTQLFYDLLHLCNMSLLLRNLSKSDAGFYTCYTILKQSTGYKIQHVNLTVEGLNATGYIIELKPELRIVRYLWISAILLPSLLLGYIVCYSRKREINRRNGEKEPLLSLDSSAEKIIHDYREHMKSSDFHDNHILPRQLLVVEGRTFCTTSGTNSGYLGEKENILKAEKLFTPETNQFRSRRMLLIGDVGVGKSYFCKWLENKWVKNESLIYKCILYVSCNRIKDKEISLKELVEQKFKDLSSVLDLGNVLLILDGLDEPLYDVDKDNITNKQKQTKDNIILGTKYGIDSHFDFNTLVGKIITKQLLPETDVLMVAHHYSVDGLHKQCTSFVLQDLTEDEAETLCKSYSADKQESPDAYKRLRTFTYTPAFVIMMCAINSEKCLEIEDYTSPYEVLTHFLLQRTAYLSGLRPEMAEKENFIKLAQESYGNLIKGKKNNMESMKQWDYFLKADNCKTGSKYQSNILRDMFAALYCVWETQSVDSFKDFLSMVFCHDLYNNSNTLLKVIAEEHSEKFYHFIRFFMRLLIYPNYNSFFNNTPTMDNEKRNVLSERFTTSILRNNSNYEKIKIIHCIYELHDEQVTRKVSSVIKEFTLFHTPLNFIDIQALEYLLRDIKLEQLDLRLCTLRDRGVRQLRNIIKNTKHVLLSCNNLTEKTATLLGEELEEHGCVIEKLELGTNQLGSVGAQTLWKALGRNRSLRMLTFYDNNIEDTYGMVEHLQNNNSLKELHLCGNTFGEKGYTNIKELRDKKKELTIVLKITENVELFQWVEEKINDLFNGAWKNYNQDWLNKLLDTVQVDLRSTNCGKDPNITNDQVDNLIQQLEKLKQYTRNRNNQKSGLEAVICHTQEIC